MVDSISCFRKLIGLCSWSIIPFDAYTVSCTAGLLRMIFNQVVNVCTVFSICSFNYPDPVAISHSNYLILEYHIIRLKRGKHEFKTVSFDSSSISCMWCFVKKTLELLFQGTFGLHLVNRLGLENSCNERAGNHHEKMFYGHPNLIKTHG